ncbi:PD-(D/E)XK nuclease family protein [Patescibacteria group bacterium]
MNLPTPSRFSYTQLAAFETCPRQYQYAHILRIPTLGSHTLSYGRSIHDTLAEFHEAINARDELCRAWTSLKKYSSATGRGSGMTQQHTNRSARKTAGKFCRHIIRRTKKPSVQHSL